MKMEKCKFLPKIFKKCIIILMKQSLRCTMTLSTFSPVRGWMTIHLIFVQMATLPIHHSFYHPLHFLDENIQAEECETRKLFVTVCCVIMLLLKYAGEVLFIWEWNRYGDQLSSYFHPLLDFRTLISFQLCGVNNVFAAGYLVRLEESKGFSFTRHRSLVAWL